MSVARRKIGFYSLYFTMRGGDDQYFDFELFQSVLGFIHSLNPSDKINIREKNNKAEVIESFECYNKQGLNLAKIIFKSCKYKHSPSLMSSIDGTERASNKGLHEGDKESTHILGNFTGSELMIILEERRAGISVGEIIKYLNKYIELYRGVENLPYFRIEYAIVPDDNFIQNLNNLERAFQADIYTHKRLLGSEGMNVMGRSDILMRDEVVVTVKAERGESLLKRNLKGIYNSLRTEGSEVTRIRIHGKDDNKTNILLDSNIIKRTEYVDATLNEERGTVDAYSFFVKLEEMYGIDNS